MTVTTLPNLKETKDAYLRLAQQFHPDSVNGDQHRFIEVKEAWDRLMELNESYRMMLVLSLDQISRAETKSQERAASIQALKRKIKEEKRVAEEVRLEQRAGEQQKIDDLVKAKDEMRQT